MKALRVTVVDTETGEEETKELPPGDYIVITADPCHVAGVQTYPMKGTHVITVEGRTAS